MELKSKIESLAEKFERTKSQISTEEATKTAFVLPFIAALGYDIFDPTEVVPEFVADVGLKKGEKVDYAIFINGSPSIIFECKHWEENLDAHTSQLNRYFGVLSVKFAVITNGHEFRFYTDIVKENRMDGKPFLSFSIEDPKDAVLSEIAKFHKENFDKDKILSNAAKLKLISEIKTLFTREIKDTSDDFAKFFAKQIIDGIATKKIVEQFKELIPNAISQLISERVNERLQKAITKEEEKIEKLEIVEEPKIITTEEELEGFGIISAILRRSIPKNRIAHRDTQSYFGVLLDNNNRKPICRLWLDGKTKYISLFDSSKKETKHKIESVDDIYNFQTELLNTIGFYDEKD